MGDWTPSPRIEVEFDLVALAYQADLTRVASYIMAAEGTNRTYNHIGIPDSFHPVSHHANDLTRIEKLAKIQTWHLEQFAGFIKKMAETPDGQGSLLDHSIFMYGSNMSNSDRHATNPEPKSWRRRQRQDAARGQHLVLPSARRSRISPDAASEGRRETRQFGDRHRHDRGPLKVMTILNRRDVLKALLARFLRGRPPVCSARNRHPAGFAA